ncbi:hypothetical protein [Azospirillum sp. sgz302134]
MQTEHDHIASPRPAGRAGDEAILDLFRQMVENKAEMHKVGLTAPDGDAGYEALIARDCAFIKAIAATPASGALGMAIKAYLRRQQDAGEPAGNPNGIDPPQDIESFDALSDKMQESMVWDALRVFPALDALRLHSEDAFRAAIAQQNHDTLRRILFDTTAPFAAAFDACRMAERDHLSKFGSDAITGEGEPSEEYDGICERFRAAAEAAPAPATLTEALAAIEYISANVDMDIAAAELPDDVKLKLLNGAWNTVYQVMKAGRAAFEQAEGGSTVIPPIGMTFHEAADLIRRKWKEAENASRQDEDRIAAECSRLVVAILTTPPQTIADARVILERLSDPDDGIDGGTGPHDSTALRNVAALLSRLPGQAVAPGDDTDLARAFLRMREIDGLMNAGTCTDEMEEEHDTLLKVVTSSAPVGLLGILVKVADILSIMPDGIPDIRTPGAPCTLALQTAMSAAEQLPDQTARSVATATMDALAGAVRALEAETDGRMRDWKMAAEWERLEATFLKYASTEQRERWTQRCTSTTRADLSAREATFLDNVAALPDDERERLFERLTLMVVQEKAHSAQIAIGRLDNTLGRYRDQLAADLAEVDAAMGTGQPDPFMDTIAAFDGASPKPLAIPDTPTDGMVQAGAAAAGIDTEQARLMFAAMVEAYRKEAA